MTFNPFEAVKDFHKKFDGDIGVPFSSESEQLRIKLIEEEFDEALEELEKFDIDRAALSKELVDMLYVIIGAGVTWNLPLEDVFKRVHYSNMTKTKEKRDDGKILKGPNYSPPQLDDLF